MMKSNFACWKYKKTYSFSPVQCVILCMQANITTSFIATVLILRAFIPFQGFVLFYYK